MLLITNLSKIYIYHLRYSKIKKLKFQINIQKYFQFNFMITKKIQYNKIMLYF